MTVPTQLEAVGGLGGVGYRRSLVMLVSVADGPHWPPHPQARCTNRMADTLAA
jgi:hypothetical protein